MATKDTAANINILQLTRNWLVKYMNMLVFLEASSKTADIFFMEALWTKDISANMRQQHND